MIKTYLFLTIAIFCEVGGTMLLPVSQNFTKIIPTTTLAILYLSSFYLLTFVVDKLPIPLFMQHGVALVYLQLQYWDIFSLNNHYLGRLC